MALAMCKALRQAEKSVESKEDSRMGNRRENKKTQARVRYNRLLSYKTTRTTSSLGI